MSKNPPPEDWDDPNSITFHIPEHVAWSMAEHIDADGLACFASDLREKLYTFRDSIV